MKAQNLDFYIVRTPPDEDELWCPECCVRSERCELESEHAALWITMSERAEQEAEDARSERKEW